MTDVESFMFLHNGKDKGESQWRLDAKQEQVVFKAPKPSVQQLILSKAAKDLIVEIDSRIQGGVEALVATKVRPCDRDSAGRYAIDKGPLRAGPLDGYLETSKYQAKLLAALRDLAKESYSSVEERNQCLVCAVETRRGTEGAKNRFVKEIMVCDVRNAILICLTVYRAMMNEQLDLPHDHVKIPIELLSGSTEQKSLMDTVGDILGSIGVEDQVSNMKEQTGEATGVVEDDEEDQPTVEEPVHNEFMLSFEDSEGEEEEDNEAIQSPVAEGPASSEQSVVQVEGVRVTEEMIAGTNGGLSGVETSTLVAAAPEAPTHNQEASIGRSLELANGATNSPAARQTPASPTDGTSCEQYRATQTGASGIGSELRAPPNEGTSIVGSGLSESRKQDHDVTNVPIAFFAPAPANIDDQGVQPLDRSVDESSLDETMYESATNDGGNSAEAGGVQDNEVMSDEVPGTGLDHEMTDASTHRDAQHALTPAQHLPNGEQVVSPGDVAAEDGTVINHPGAAIFAHGGAMIDNKTDQVQQQQVIEPAAITEAGTEVGIEQVESEPEDMEIDPHLASMPQHAPTVLKLVHSEPVQPYINEKTEAQLFWEHNRRAEAEGHKYFQLIGEYRVETQPGEIIAGPQDKDDVDHISKRKATRYFDPEVCSFFAVRNGYVVRSTEWKPREIIDAKRSWMAAEAPKTAFAGRKFVYTTQPRITPGSEGYEVKSVLGPRGVYVSDLEVGQPKARKLACK
ncbi:hypothetical protein LTS10_001110 [Elasticomyces elasticus]|nr:hypothetical protein LTS10_001110 [Elasticomyces elasticus]